MKRRRKDGAAEGIAKTAVLTVGILVMIAIITITDFSKSNRSKCQTHHKIDFCRNSSDCEF